MSLTLLTNGQDVSFHLVDENDFISQVIRLLGASIANELSGDDNFPPLKIELYTQRIMPTERKTGTIVQVTLADDALAEAIVNYLDGENGTSYFIGIVGNRDGTLSVLPQVVAESLDDEPAFLQLTAFDRASLLR